MYTMLILAFIKAFNFYKSLPWPIDLEDYTGTIQTEMLPYIVHGYIELYEEYTWRHW